MNRLFLFFLIPVFFLPTACKQDVCEPLAATAETLFILPLGDSRVEGYRPAHESYRYSLWKLLIENEWDVDFIGSRKDNAMYEAVNLLCFDNEHEGTGGAMTTDILATLAAINLDRTPDIALLGIGGNDLLDGELPPIEVVDNLREIIDALQTINPEITILLEEIAPGRSDIMTAEFTSTFNQFNQMVGMLEDLNGSSKVVVIDMAEDWKDTYMADNVHYNLGGAEVVAQRYFQAMQTHVVR
ncbi:MAG: SGNH/GDSL hydrolase family protein [Bacteroidota bacterium]